MSDKLLKQLYNVRVHRASKPDTNYEFTNSKGDVISLNGKEQEKFIRKGVQAFMRAPIVCQKMGDRYGKLQAFKSVQAFTSSSDITKITTDVFTVTQEEDNFDLFWQSAFKGIELSQGELEWEITNVANGLVYELIPEGGKIKYQKVDGTKINAQVEKYGTGLSVTWETIEGRKLYKFYDQMKAARAALFTLWANIHYGLLATAGATNQIAYDTVGTGELEKDIRTLNTGLHTISEANKDKGYGDPTAAAFSLYPDPILEERIEAAFRATTATLSQQGITGTQVKRRRVSRFYSYNSNIPTLKALLVWNGQKIQNAEYLKDLNLKKVDQDSLNELSAHWTAFGAIIGDTDQVYELNFVTP